MSIRIVLADDHRMFREAIRAQLAVEDDIEVVAETGTGEETLAAVASTDPDLVVLDIGLPGINGIDVARALAKAQPQVGIVALSGYADRVFVEEMMKAGARGYVVKSAGSEELLGAIRAAAEGRHYLSSEVTGAMVRHLDGEGGKAAPPVAVLSRREQDILRLMASGKRTSAIAGECGIAVGTVEVHRRNIKQKLGLRTTAELTRYAIREGLIAA